MSVKNLFLALVFLAAHPLFPGGEKLSLEESIRLGIENNIQTRISEERIIQAEAGKEEAYTLFYPRLSSSFSYTRLDKAQETSFGGLPPVRVTDANLYNLNLGLVQPLYTGRQIDFLYAKASESVQQAGFEKETLALNLAFEIKKGYFAILKAGKVLQTALSLKNSAEEHLKVARSFFSEGAVTRADVLKTEVFLANAQQQILQAENMKMLAETSFSFLLNRPLSENLEVEDILEIQKSLKTLEFWTRAAYRQRPELKSLASAAKIYGYDIDIEKSSLKPQVSFFSNYQVDRGSQEKLDRWQNSWNLGISIEMEIWDRGETRQRIKQAESRKTEIEQEYLLQKKTVELEVKNSYINLLSAGKEIATLKKTIEKAEENLRITDMLYREGMAANTDVLDARTDLTAAKNSYYQALYQYQVAYGELEKASGLLPEK